MVVTLTFDLGHWDEQVTGMLKSYCRGPCLSQPCTISCLLFPPLSPAYFAVVSTIKSKGTKIPDCSFWLQLRANLDSKLCQRSSKLGAS